MLKINKNNKSDKIDITNIPTKNRQHNNITYNDNTSRLDAVEKVTGRAKYTMDKIENSPVVASFFRCPWGNAKLVSGNIDEVANIPGVIVARWENGAIGKTFTYHGQPVALIAADNIHALRRALLALQCEWQRLPVTHDIDSANPDGPEFSDIQIESTKSVLEDADYIVDAVYSTSVQTHSSMEPHGGFVDYKGNMATVYGSTQSCYGYRDGLARALDLSAGAIDMHCEYVGGGFGSKLGPGKEGQNAARLSKQLNRPVIMFCSRRDEHLDTGNRPSSRQHFKIGIAKSGEILGGSIGTFGGTGVAGRGGGLSSQRYNLGDVSRVHKDVTFNGGSPRAMRAPGHPMAMFAAELLMDELAAGINMDPLTLRLKHDPSEYRKKMYPYGAKLIGWKNRKANGSQTDPIKIGYGMGITDWPEIPVIGEAEVVIHRDGSVEARSGTQDMGQGQRTIMGVVAAKQLGIPLSFVESKVGSTAYPQGPASGGSMTATNTAPAMKQAADKALAALLALVAENIGGVPAGNLRVENGVIIDTSNNNNKKIMDWVQACNLITTSINERGKVTPGDLDMRGTGNSEGVQFAKVAVDTETGVVKVERIIAIQSGGHFLCRKTAENQVIGGVTQGISYALFENRLLDRQTGAMVNSNFEQYKIAGTADIPDIVPILWEDENATGVRGIGEPPTIPTSGAIACAVYNAIGVPVRSGPITPDKVLHALAADGSRNRKGGGA